MTLIGPLYSKLDGYCKYCGRYIYDASSTARSGEDICSYCAALLKEPAKSKDVKIVKKNNEIWRNKRFRKHAR